MMDEHSSFSYPSLDSMATELKGHDRYEHVCSVMFMYPCTMRKED